MKKLLLLAVICLTVAGGAFAQTAASFTFSNSGNNFVNVNPTSTFTMDIAGTFNFSSTGYSLWLEAPTGFASSLSITNVVYSSPFTDSTDNGYPKSFSSTIGQTNSGFLTDTDTVVNPKSGSIDSGDIGATGFSAAGTFNLATVSFSLAGAAPGSYTIFSTTVSPKGSEFSAGSPSFASVFTPRSGFVINVVPEPATWSLMGLGGIGALGLTWLRARRRS